MAPRHWLRQGLLYARFLWISVPLALMIVGIIYYSQDLANNAAFNSLQSIKDNHHHKTIIDKINNHFQSIEKQIYRHTVYHDSESREIIRS